VPTLFGILLSVLPGAIAQEQTLAPEGTPAAESAIEPGPPGAGEKLTPGKPFPPLTVQILRPGAGRPEPLDLPAGAGARPFLLAYFMMGYSVSEEIVSEVQHFVTEEAGGKVALYPVVRLGGRYEITELVEKMRLLGLESPVLLDEDGRLQRALGVTLTPHMALIDGSGVLCFTGASSLKQPILGEVDLREAIRMAARGENPPVVPGLAYHYPAVDLVGERFRDFTLPAVVGGQDVRLSDHVKPGRVTALLYWSVWSRYSRQAIPSLAAGFKAYRDKYLELISVVRLKPGETRDAVEKVISGYEIEFPVLEDRGRRFTTLYRAISTPTLIIIRPDGIVDSVYTSGKADLYSVLLAKMRVLVMQAPAPGAGAGSGAIDGKPSGGPEPSKPKGR